jgi:type I restriction enzyme S subunit
MKEGWKYKTFAECVVKIPKQKQVKSKDYKSAGLYPIVSQEKEIISGYWDDKSYLFTHDKPVIIFGDHTKEIKYIDFDFVVGADGTQILSPQDDIDAKFFYYTLLSTPIRALGYARHFKLLKEKCFYIPCLDEQRLIASRLDAAFSHIDELKANAEKQLSEARALFQKSLAKAMESKRGWEKRTLDNICNLNCGFAFDSKGYTNKEDDILLVCGDNIIHCGFRWETIKRWPKEDYEGLNRFALKENDIVLAMDRPWVKSGLKIAKISKNELPSLLIQRTACIRSGKNTYPAFLYYALQTEAFIKHLVTQQTGVGVPHISGRQILSFDISIPPLSEQQRIVERLDALSAHVRELEENQKKIISECDALKQALLRKVFE